MVRGLVRTILLFVMLVLLTGCTGRASDAEPQLAGALTVRTPAILPAGKPLTVVAERLDAPDGLEALLLAQGSYGPVLYRARFQGGRAEFHLPGEDTRVAGLVALTARAGAAEGHADLTITPGEVVAPLTALVGPRTIIADGAHWGTAAVIPFDSHGNPVAAGTPVEFYLVRPNARTETISTTVQHLVGWERVWSATVAGRTTVIVRVGQAHGHEASLTETPGWPVRFALSAPPRGLPADGRQLVALRTSPIVDRYGNQMLDGTLVTFVVEAPDSTLRLIPAYTINGVAEAYLQSPATPGRLTAYATLYGVKSLPLRLDFKPGLAVGTIAVRASVDQKTGIVTLEAGPLLGNLGQLVPEGTEVRFTLAGPEGWTQTFTAATEDGWARLELWLADLVPGSYQVEVTVGANVGETQFTAP
ncbi:hypothetical protein EYB53_004190 [Candidatus Chloroploca sp. M-50]|uniref:Lipoprotein n=1 Tax=Candidatus Chloroploca mongolica TaxID=2528176 RepID=A0ABS4D641_9CHLR|nr:hypothetical protein [Candidatus Chloroploca mongolica]MBP1464903.1 hypothetical protein [Candidatus Chloroploca mongolica]